MAYTVTTHGTLLGGLHELLCGQWKAVVIQAIVMRTGHHYLLHAMWFVEGYSYADHGDAGRNDIGHHGMLYGMLCGRLRAGCAIQTLAEGVLAKRVLAKRVLAKRVLAKRVLAKRVLANNTSAWHAANTPQASNALANTP